MDSVGRKLEMLISEIQYMGGLERILSDQLMANGVTIPVRCKDCKHWKKGEFKGGNDIESMEWGGGCPLSRFARYESDFCSRGERKDNG